MTILHNHADQTSLEIRLSLSQQVSHIAKLALATLTVGESEQHC